MKTVKIILTTILTLELLYIVTIFILESYIEKKLNQEKNLSFKEFNMSFGGILSFKKLKYKNDLLDIQVEDVSLNIGIMRIITSDTILIDKAIVHDVKLNYYKRDADTTQVKTNQQKKKKKREIKLHEVIISGLDLYSIENKDTLTSVIGLNLQAKLNNIKNCLKRNNLDTFF